MRRLAAVVLAVSILAGGCASDKKEAGSTTTARSSSSSSSSSSSFSVTTTTAPEPCQFTFVAGDGEITWVANGRLLARTVSGVAHCLAEGFGSGGDIQWSGDGSKVLVDNAVVIDKGRQQEFARSFGLVLSRPTGRSVIAVGGERIEKYEDGATTPADITFVSQPSDVVYHPAGRSIVAAGTENGHPVVKLATNRGADAKAIALGETAQGVHDLAFTASNALLFVGDHGSEAHLHRLELASGKLTTVATADHIEDVTTSAFPGGGVAWTTGSDCALVVEQDAKFISVKDTPVARARPVGWLPDRSLVVHTGCNSATGDIYVVAAGAAPKLVVADVASGVAVRALLPEPAAPPASVPNQAPA